MNSRFPKEIDFKRGMIIREQDGIMYSAGKDCHMRVAGTRQRKGCVKEIKIYVIKKDRRALSWISASYLSKFYEVVEQC